LTVPGRSSHSGSACVTATRMLGAAIMPWRGGFQRGFQVLSRCECCMHRSGVRGAKLACLCTTNCQQTALGGVTWSKYCQTIQKITAAHWRRSGCSTNSTCTGASESGMLPKTLADMCAAYRHAAIYSPHINVMSTSLVIRPPILGLRSLPGSPLRPKRVMCLSLLDLSAICVLVEPPTVASTRAIRMSSIRPFSGAMIEHYS
jgi:hypothetical protein